MLVAGQPPGYRSCCMEDIRHDASVQVSDLSARPAKDNPGAGRHDLDLHLRVLRLPHPHPAARAGPDRAGRAGKEGNVTIRLRREVSYQWRLREVMATRGLFATTELVPLLAERGISLSASQVHRLVTGIPERLSLPVLAALCDILECTPAELIATRAANAAPRKTGTGDPVATAELPVDLRPRRARLRPQ
jgi:DNA-binding Xre family transcriptional regulator